MSNNPFVLPKEQYVRDLNILKHSVEQYAQYISIQTGCTIEEAAEYAKTALRPGGDFEFKDPQIQCNLRAENGDKSRSGGTLMGYINDSIAKGELIAPTLTTYSNPKVKKSLLVDYIDGNVAARSKAKKEMFKAESAGDMGTYILKKIEQTNKKLANNAISGAHVTPSTPLYNKTAHSTLTSNCRSTSGYGNANNEKFLSGNRHYWSYEIVVNNITSIVTNSKYDEIEAVMGKYNIVYPTPDQVMECIEYSARLYWRDQFKYDKLKEYVTKLTPIQRAAFVYTGDIYHLRKFNDAMVREFITKLSSRIDVVDPNPVETMKVLPDDIRNLAAQLCETFMKGKSAIDPQFLKPDERDTTVFGTPDHGILASTAKHINDTILEYADLISAFWVTANVPASVAYFPESIRRAALTSDTDSTIFTVQDWVLWFFGNMDMSHKGNAVAASVVFLAAQSIIHVLARMSANFGIETERIHQVAMKNEFKFDVFVPTQVAKHYFAFIGCQEGLLKKEHEDEIKGVHLKNSNTPASINEKTKKIMLDIMGSILEGKKISRNEYLKRIGDIEREIYASIRKGDREFLRIGQIKTAESYTKSPDESPYIHYTMWQEVFADKYGDAPPPPFATVKVSTTLDSKSKTKAWLDSWEDQELAKKMANWMEKNKKLYITTFQLPDQVVQTNGIPEEIFSAMDIRKLVFDSVKTAYIVAEAALGVYMTDDKITQMISDYY